MKKKIVVFLSVIVALLPFFCISASADSGGFTYIGAFVANNNVTWQTVNTGIFEGKTPGNVTSVYTYLSTVYSDCDFQFKLGHETLVMGDTFTYSGVIGVPYGTTTIELNCFGSYGHVDLLNTVKCSFYGEEVTYAIYKFSRTINWTSAPYTSDMHIILRGSHSTVRTGLQVYNLQYTVNNDPSVALDVSANKINQGTQSAINGQTNETYGYNKIPSNNTDSGLSSGSNLIESLTDSISSFNSSLDSNVSNLLVSIDGYKNIVHSVFNILPALVQYLLVFGLVFLVIRKVVGR